MAGTFLYGSGGLPACRRLQDRTAARSLSPAEARAEDCPVVARGRGGCAGATARLDEPGARLPAGLDAAAPLAVVRSARAEATATYTFRLYAITRLYALPG